jgi:hypothetical protein
VCSKKTIAPRCRGSRSRGGRGRETRSRSLIFGRGRRSSVNDRQSDTTKGHRQTDLPSSIVRASRSPAREADSSARVCAGHGVRARGKIEGGRRIRPGRLRQRQIWSGRRDLAKGTANRAEKAASTWNPAGKVATATTPTKAMKGWAARRVQPGRGLRRSWQVVLTTAMKEA